MPLEVVTEMIKPEDIIECSDAQWAEWWAGFCYTKQLSAVLSAGMDDDTLIRTISKIAYMSGYADGGRLASQIVRDELEGNHDDST